MSSSRLDPINEYKTRPSPETTSRLPVILEVLFLFALIAALCLLPTADGHEHAAQASASTATVNGDNPR